MAHDTTTPAGLLDRFRENVRTLKALRNVSDTDIAEYGRYASRQLLNHRITGRTVPTLDDLARIAGALKVDPGVILSPLGEIITWIEQNRDYDPGEMPPLLENRDLRPAAVQPPQKKKTAPTKKASGQRRPAPAR